MALLSGKTGSVLVNGVPKAFGKWKLQGKCPVVKVNNFLLAFRQIVAGLPEGTVTISGPHDVGNLGLVVGQSYAFTLGWTPSLAITVTAIVSDGSQENDVEDAPRVGVTAEINGAFNLTMI